MSRKLYALLLPVLAIAAMAITVGAAQAEEPHWYSCHEVAAGTGKYSDADCTKKVAGNFELTRLPFTSAKVQVITWGTLTLHTAVGEIVCKVSDAGNIWNVNLATPGKDEVVQFTLYECSIVPATACKKGLSVAAEKLPWPTELIVVAGVIRVKITGINIRVKCEEPAVNLLFTGELTPKFVNNSPSFAEFGEGSGHLTNSEVGEATVTGKDKVLGFENQEEIQAFIP